MSTVVVTYTLKASEEIEAKLRRVDELEAELKEIEDWLKEGVALEIDPDIPPVIEEKE